MPSFNATELALQAQVTAEIRGSDVYSVVNSGFEHKFAPGLEPGMLTQFYVLSRLFAV